MVKNITKPEIIKMIKNKNPILKNLTKLKKEKLIEILKSLEEKKPMWKLD
jgi:hypothetical protein